MADDAPCSDGRDDSGATITYVLTYGAGDDLKAEYELSSDATILGRLEGCDLQLPDPAVSGEHARIQMVDDRLTIADLGSQNGTFVMARGLMEAEAFGFLARLGRRDGHRHLVNHPRPLPGGSRGSLEV